jgi:hypothetical protein
MRQGTFTLFGFSVLFWCSALAIAQQPAGTTPTTRTAEITVRGCVSGGKRYTFMQSSTRAIFALQGDSSRFAPVEGKLIEITANEFAPQPNSGELPVLRVDDLRVVADKCPIEARAGSNKGSVPATNQGANSGSPATVPYADPGTLTQRPPNVNNPNISGDTGSPSPGTGNPPKPPQ